MISFRNAMQLYFPFFVSCSLFLLQVVVKLFDYFWQPNGLFSKFCVICLMMYYFVHCNNCAFKDVNGAYFCTCSLVTLCVPEMCFWPAKTLKKLYLFEMHICVWPGAQIRFRHKWRNWLQVLFYFIFLMGGVASVIGMSFFQLSSRF